MTIFAHFEGTRMSWQFVVMLPFLRSFYCDCFAICEPLNDFDLFWFILFFCKALLSVTCRTGPLAMETRLLSPLSKEVVWSASIFAVFLLRFRRLDKQCEGHIQKNIRRIQQIKPRAVTKTHISQLKHDQLEQRQTFFFSFTLPINAGPISLNSTVLNPFSPVPTKAITRPMATVPNPT